MFEAIDQGDEARVVSMLRDGFDCPLWFSCKRRGFCPGCVARRIVDIGVHLEQRVLPEAPVRHWILAAVIAELGRSRKWRAKKLLGLSSVSDATCLGGIAAVGATLPQRAPMAGIMPRYDVVRADAVGAPQPRIFPMFT